MDWTLDIEVFDDGDGDGDGVEDGMGKDKDGQKRGETDVIYKDQSLSCLAHGMTTGKTSRACRRHCSRLVWNG